MRELDPEFLRLAEAFFLVRRHKHSLHASIDAAAERFGCWDKLGSGYYGEAWRHANWPDLVVKISGPAGWGFDNEYSLDWERHDAWPVFARHCKAHPHPNLPKILHFEQVNQRMAWAVMPRYTTLKGWVLPSIARHWSEVLHGEADGDEWLWPLRQMVSALDFTVDLHGANIMQDRAGNYIITDPFSDPAIEEK